MIADPMFSAIVCLAVGALIGAGATVIVLFLLPPNQADQYIDGYYDGYERGSRDARGQSDA